MCPSVNYHTNVFTNDFCEGICDGAGEDKSAVSVDSDPVCVDVCSAGEDQSVDSVPVCVNECVASEEESVCLVTDECVVCNEVSPVDDGSPTISRSREEVRELQCQDEELVFYVKFLDSGFLPSDDQTARKVILGSKLFELIDGLLYHENPTCPGR